jgi:hypothetical protein
MAARQLLEYGLARVRREQQRQQAGGQRRVGAEAGTQRASGRGGADRRALDLFLNLKQNPILQ